MIEPQKLAAAINSKTPSGQSAFTPQQIADLAAKENSPFQKRLKRAMDLGVTKEQALKFYAFGTAGGPQEKEPPKTGFFDQISQQFQSVAQNVQGRRVAFGQDIENFQNRQHGVASTLEGVSQLALRFPGRAAQAAGDMIGGLAAPLVQNAPEIASTALQGVGIPNEVTQQRFNEAGRVLSGVIQSEPVQAVAKFYQGLDSDTRADVESMAALGLASLDIAPGINATPKVLKEVGEGSLSGARGIAKAVFRPKTVEQLLPQLDAAIGQIIQGDKESLKAARSAFQIVDTQGVRTYEDLNQTLRENVKALATKQNAILDAVQDVHTLDSFARTSKVGSQTATTNHVANALNHLEELYLKTGNMDDYVRIKAMKESAATEGLTARQVNNIAREYGVEMPKGFNPKTGDPLTSINSQLTENTRMGVKEAARSILPDDTSRLLDEQMSSLFDTLRNTERVENGVLKLAQKVMKRGILEKVGRLLGRTIDVATGHGLRGFAQSIFPSNVGLKQMNFLQIQDALVSNLGKVEDLIKRIDTMEPDKAAKEVYQLIKESSPKGPIPFSHRSIESESRTLQLRGGQKGRPGIDKPAPLPQPQAQTSVNGGSVGGVQAGQTIGTENAQAMITKATEIIRRNYEEAGIIRPDVIDKNLSRFLDFLGGDKQAGQQLLATSNPTSRKIFEEITGITLPKTVAGTRELVEKFNFSDVKVANRLLNTVDESPKALPRDGATAGIPKELEPLAKEARKYKSAEEFVKGQLDKNSFVVKNPVKVFRGEGKGIGNSTLVKGRYFADSKKFAETFGAVTEDVIPSGSKVFDLDAVKSGDGVIDQTMLVDPDALTKFLIDNGFDYTKNTNTRGVEYVQLNKTLNELESLAGKSDSLSDFRQAVMKDYDKYRGELARISKDYTQADSSRMRSPIDDIYNNVKRRGALNTKSQLTDLWKKANNANQ